ncbi:MAG: 2OG-Fe(II) oxygenase family protein [Gammaproteobacteria bacterium]
MAVPVIDFSGFTAGSVADRNAVAADVRRAAEQVGFMTLTGAAMSAELLDQAFAASRAFFAWPLADKNRLRYRSTQLNHGYVAQGQEALDPARPTDLKESFTMRNVTGNRVRTELWPDPSFQETALAFFQQAQRVAADVLAAFAIGFGLPATFFSQHHTGENQTLRFLHYPPVAGDLQPAQLGAGAHSDYGSVTLLWQGDQVGGLEVLAKNGSWQPVTPVPGAVVVNIGDLLERWTNGVLRSTRHRVQPRVDGRERYSIAFFCDPDSATEVVTLPACVSGERPDRYPPVQAGEYIRQRLNATY